MAESLSEYLVKLGWQVDTSGFDKAKSISNSLKTFLLGDGKIISSTVAGAFSVVYQAIAKVNMELVDFISNVAQSDLEIERQARRFWASEQNVRSYDLALKALKVTEADLFLMTDEQYGQFKELYDLGRSLEAPPELDEFLVKIRDVEFQFRKIGVMIEYARRQVVYFLSKLIGGDVERIRNWLRNFVDFIQKNLPKISEIVANFFNVFFRLGKTVFDLAVSIFRIFKNFVSAVPSDVITISTALLVLFRIIKSGPIGWLISALTLILLLIDDYRGWAQGEESYFDWSAADEVIQNIKKNFKELKDTWDELTSVFDEFNLGLDGLDGKDIFIKLLANAFSVLNSVLSFTVDRLKELFELLKIGDEKVNELNEKTGGKSNALLDTLAFLASTAGIVGGALTANPLLIGAGVAGVGSTIGKVRGHVNDLLYANNPYVRPSTSNTSNTTINNNNITIEDRTGNPMVIADETVRRIARVSDQNHVY